jgi:ribA/ribD-fused uncharacterized protein
MAYKNGDYKRYFFENETTIFGFFEKYRFLSNFHRCPVSHGGYVWPSSEHAYMAAKCFRTFDEDGCVRYNRTKYLDIRSMSCSQVRSWGQKVDLRLDWEDVKVSVMSEVCLNKFAENHDLKKALLETGGKTLVEANSWGDRFWGYDVDNKCGSNNLGKVLMHVRYCLL